MKRIISILVVTIILCSTVFMPSSAASSKGVKEEYLNSDKWLSLSKNTTGPRYFVDTKGNPVNLFGTARCKHHQNEEDVLYTNGGEADVNSLTEHYAGFGMNFMRLSIFPRELCGGEVPTDKEVDTYLTQYVDPDVQAIIKSGMYVMIDLHLYPQQETKYSVKTASEIVNYARKYYIPILKGVARMYKDEPMVAVYEVWNEPYPADQQDLDHNVSEWNSLLRDYFIDAVNEIRKIDTRHVIMVSDFNAGWGMCTGVTWNGYFDKVDPVYRNTCFSTHIARSHVTTEWNNYYSWYKSFTRDKNICIVFGEIETEGDLMSTEGMKTLLNFFEETKNEYHFSGNLWRPHGWHAEYHELWAQNGWADKYCNVGPYPTARYVSEAEDRYGDKNDNIEILNANGLFGYETANGISMKAGLSATQFYESTSEAANNRIYKAGKYKLMVRAAGKKGYDGDFIIGYRDIDGVVHQIARFAGKNTSGKPYYQSIEFTAKKQLVSFVYFGCESSKKSAIIDRVYIEGAKSEKETAVRLRTDFADINKIIDLNGKSYSLKAGDTSNTVSSNNNTDSKPDSSNKADTDNIVDNNSDENDKPDKENVEQSYGSNTTTQKGSSENYALYIWIGAGLIVVLALFITIYIIVVKAKNKKAISDTEGTEEN